MRMHICWGNYEGPHDHDIPLEKILGIVFKAKPAAILFEAANPRHRHEWAVWRDARIPDNKILIPGCIASTSNYVEHPELVAQQICQYADIVGRERVIAGTDCGFGTFVGSSRVDPDIAYRKLESLVAGAQLASQRLW
jgi:5-methyltetrahydropteroyltriglutamate--homocysteine methyltransferase